MRVEFDENQRKALYRLLSSEDFKVFLEALKTELLDRDLSNRELVGIELYRNQGATCLLADLVDSIQDARVYVYKS